MQMGSWQELANPRDLTKIFTTPEYAAWRSLRESEDARYLGLAMPRFLARLPYGAKTNPVEAFNFEEDTAGGDHGKYSWANSAYAMATNINRSFKLYGWCTRIRGVESGGAVEGLPVAHLPHRRRWRGHEVPDRDRHHATGARPNSLEERLHAAVCTARTAIRRLHRRAVLQKPFRSTTTSMPPPTPTWRRACPTCLPPAVLRTT